MKRIRIKEAFVSIRNGANIKQDKTSGGIPITRIETIADNIIDLTKLGYANINGDEFSDYYLKDGDILMSHINSVSHLGKVGIFENINQTIIHGMNLLCLRADKRVLYPKYAYYFFKTPGFIHSLKPITKKSVNQASFNISDFENLNVYIASLSDQIKIATVLSKAEALIKNRKENIDLLDGFLKSAFLKMFGDPIKNERGWEKRKVGDVIESIRYGTSTPPEYQQKGIPFIRATNIKNGRISEKGMVFISQAEANKIEKCKVKAGDLIIVRSGVNTGDAATVTIDYDGCYAGYDLILDINPVTSVFYNAIINSPFGRTKIKPLTQRSGQPHLNADQVKNLEFYFPPFELQQEFKIIVDKIESLKEILDIGLKNLEILYASLSQKAFKGELDLSEMQINHIDPISTGGSEEISNLEAISKKENQRIGDKPSKKEEVREVDPFAVDEATAKKQGAVFFKKWQNKHSSKAKSKVTWDKVSSQQVAEWVKEKYRGYHFSTEMLIRFLMDEYVVFPDYYSSEELKKYPHLNGADDLKSFIFSALSDDKFFIQLEQHFYNAEKETFTLKVTDEDYTLIESREMKERSGIYFSIINK